MGDRKDNPRGEVLYGDAGRKEKYTSSDILARNIIRGIYEGRYVPGHRLVEQDLTEDYGVSRSTVREAIKLLKADGIITNLPYKGAEIRKLSREEALNILAVTEVIIGLAARQAAENIDKPGARDMLASAVDGVLDSAGAGTKFEFIQQRNRFYSTLIRISGNTELLRFMQKLQVHLVRNTLAVPREERIAGYGEIAEHIANGDAAGAEDRARRYARRIAELLVAMY